MMWLTLQLSNNQPKSGLKHPLLTLTPDILKTEKQKNEDFKRFLKILYLFPAFINWLD